MNVSIGGRWAGFVERAVKSARYGSASEVVQEGLRLVEERDASLSALRDTLDASIAEGGSVSNDLAAALDVKAGSLANKLEATGIGASASVRRTVAGEPLQKGGILKALRDSPLVGAEFDLERTREPGHDVDL